MGVADAEKLWRLDRLRALLAAHQEADQAADPLFRRLIERYAREVLGDEAANAGLSEEAWFDLVEALGTERRVALASVVTPAQEKAATGLAHLDEIHRFWGVTRS